MLYCLLLPPASKASQGSSRRLFKSRALLNGTSTSHTIQNPSISTAETKLYPLCTSTDTRTLLIACPDGASSAFTTLSQDIARPLRNAILVDLVRRKQITKASCLDLLQRHIKHNTWQVGSKLFRQKRGIPQGSKISSLLCSFFYAALEREHLAFLKQPGSVSSTGLSC
jgi:telomerase reverse transcriptase